ncbi:MAG: ABC transporter substrate-binding protein [Arenicellales bacterium]|jgi:branched-chain amino acid transport system substrate-binding protein|nr:ABC transporter substrate-binding protein [Arenicellales bacterium]MDP7518037.1 ABC transporter substrate-binding protein [Arenicellales bacterium]|tara:strand:+ start:1392 stop:2702 length:1311 start_codon:yes stop_codon:yes gene_type:complete
MTKKSDTTRFNSNRRTAIKRIGALAGASGATQLMPGFMAYAYGSDEPIKVGMQLHRTGIGASYGRWYERVATATAKLINEEGGINGRPLELVIEDDGTDPKRGAEVVEKFATLHKVDVAYGTLFSHVVIGSSPRAGELKLPYYVVSEGHHVASGKLNRYVFQPGITDVKSQVISMAPWISQNLGKKVTMIYPDFAFGHDHRDYFSAAIKEQGGEVLELIPIPPTESSFTRYFPRIPSATEVLYHVMVGPGVLTFVKELGQHFGSSRPEIFGFIDSLEAVDLATPQLEFLEGTHFWEGNPRYAQANQSEHDKFYRQRVGVDENGASVNDPKDISTYAHMFGCWETLFVIKQAMELSGYKGQSADDKQALIEATESLKVFEHGRNHPQGKKTFNGMIHQSFGHQYISRVEDSRLKVVHTTPIEDGLYEPEADYTKMAL